MALTDSFDYEIIKTRRGREQSSRRLILVLHGRGDSLKPFRSIDRELGINDSDFLLLNAPRRYDGGFTWYGFPPRQRNGVLIARTRLKALIHDLNEAGYSNKNIYLLGFSQGALVGLDLFMNLEHPLGGIVAISGYLYFFRKWRQRLQPASFQTPVLVTHGLQDEDLPLADTRRQVLRLQDAGLPVLWKEFEKEHEIELEEEAPYIRRWLNFHHFRNENTPTKASNPVYSDFFYQSRNLNSKSEEATFR